MPGKKAKPKDKVRSAAAPRKKVPSRTLPRTSARDTVYQVKITLEGIRPPIWRRIETKDCTLGRLHDLIQTSMGWGDAHLHEFEIGNERFGAREQWDDDFSEAEMGNERSVKLSQLADQGVKKFRYDYDMGDSWSHLILIEKQESAEPGIAYPRCVAGERACPPEDCGGVWGYGDLLVALEKPTTPRQQELLEWIGGEFDPEVFDVAAVNRRLKG